jgi:hypothetical protein
MHDRLYYLNHVSELTAEELFHAINQGIVELEDLIKTGNLDRSKRQEIRNMLQNLAIEENEFWKNCKGINDWQEYLKRYPSGKYFLEASKLSEEFWDDQRKKNLERTRLVKDIKENPNSYKPDMIMKFVKSGTISFSDLSDAGIPKDIINKLNYSISTPEMKLGIPPTSIPEGFTEVYFWGFMGSGKTCALGSILGTAYSKGYLEMASGPSFDYMLKLRNIFMEPISILPGATPDKTQYLPFTLKKEHERYARSISLIELSGEIFQCFLYRETDKPFPTDLHEESFNTLLQFLNGSNRKIHFFFVDYEQENKPDASGYYQSDYLSAATAYFNSPDNKIFTEKTDAIYIVLTKSDLIKCSKEERIHHVKDYLLGNNYSAFVNALRSKCIQNSINGKRLLGLEFSLGQLYFKDFCKHDSTSAENIIDILMSRVQPQKESVLDFLNR